MARLAPVILPLELRLVNVPTLVILGCAGVYTVPATRALATCPVILPAGIAVNNEPLPMK